MVSKPSSADVVSIKLINYISCKYDIQCSVEDTCKPKKNMKMYMGLGLSQVKEVSILSLKL